MSNRLSNTVNNFKADPNDALNMLEVVVGFDLNQSQRSMATVLGLQAAAGGLVSLNALVESWHSSPMLTEFVFAVSHRLLKDKIYNG